MSMCLSASVSAIAAENEVAAVDDRNNSWCLRKKYSRVKAKICDARGWMACGGDSIIYLDTFCVLDFPQRHHKIIYYGELICEDVHN